jgi:hypothetical protein
MFGFRGSYDFLYNSFVKAGGGSTPDPGGD